MYAVNKRYGGRVPQPESLQAKQIGEGNTVRIVGMSICLAKKRVDQVIERVRLCNREIKLRLVLQNGIGTIVASYTLQVRVSNE